MASYTEHINQAKRNLSFLGKINKNIENSWDWQVTVCFYVSVHLVNAHIAAKSNQHYRSHEQVKEALNPFRTLSVSKFSENNYLAFDKLQNLSRRSRYLCSDNMTERSVQAFFTFDKHLYKALKSLDQLLMYMQSEYSEEFTGVVLDCIEMKNGSLHFFSYTVWTYEQAG